MRVFKWLALRLQLITRGEEKGETQTLIKPSGLLVSSMEKPSLKDALALVLLVHG